MNLSHQFEPTSSDRLLTCLCLAIEEAKLLRKSVESRGLAQKRGKQKPISPRLANLNRDIGYLEKKLAEIRNLVNKSSVEHGREFER